MALLLVHLLTLWLSVPCFAPDPPTAVVPADGRRWQYPLPERTVVIGDTHADPDALLQILEHTGLLNARGNWQGGAAHLVLMGDLVDRGPSSRPLFDLVIRLQKQARRSGGQVHALYGNHELMQLRGDLGDTTDRDLRDYRDFAQNAEERARVSGDYVLAKRKEKGLLIALTGSSEYGEFMRDRNTVIQLGRNLFVHAGLEGWALRHTPAEINASVRAWVNQITDPSGPMPDPRSYWVLEDTGPLWTRAMASGNLPDREFLDILKAWKVSRVFLGHSVTKSREIETRYGGKVVLTDTAISSGMGGGSLSAVEIDSRGHFTHHNNIPRPAGAHPLRRQCAWQLSQVK